MEISISIDDQLLRLFESDEMIREYPISSAAKGVGFREQSFRTPTGQFRICEKIGYDLPWGTIFKAREAEGQWSPGDISAHELITSRILRLDGLDPENKNTLARCIYIHGTNQEEQIGTPASHGCIRMSNIDVMELFDLTPLDTLVSIEAPQRQRGKLIFFDCDSTLSTIEGIDELARARGTEIFQQVVDLTNAAMNGEIPLHDVFPKRMEIIRPDKTTCEIVAQKYLDTIVSGVRETLQTLREEGWTIIIISGGFAPLIAPLAETLGVEFVEAVPLFLDDSGSYAGYDTNFLTTCNGGKPEIIREWKSAMRPKTTVMVGDGISDLESRNEVDMFIGFGGVVVRETVKSSAKHFVENFADIPALVKKAAKR